jgi:CheY-like chemotaxis protein
VVVTASVMKRERKQAMDAGADFFVEKPFEIDRLRDAVAEACKGRK